MHVLHKYCDGRLWLEKFVQWAGFCSRGFMCDGENAKLSRGQSWTQLDALVFLQQLIHARVCIFIIT